jgi:TPR repeat protein
MISRFGNCVTVVMRRSGVPQVGAVAVGWLRKTADQDFAETQNHLALMSGAGRGVPQDYAAAVNWLQKAADPGLGSAQNNLGIKCETGRGVQQDNAAALSWYRKAADQGEPPGNTISGSGIRRAKVPQRYVAAVWVSKARRSGLCLGPKHFWGRVSKWTRRAAKT